MTFQKNAKARIAAPILAFVLAACAAQPPSDPRHIGTVTMSSGVPSVIRQGKTYILAKQSRIYPGDIVQTNKTSRVQVIMIDDTVISLGYQSHFVFHRYKYKRGGLFPEARITFTRGAVRAKTGEIAAAWFGRFEIETPLAVIDARTADFWATLAPGENTLEVAMAEGKKILVSNDHGSIKIKHAGFGTSVTAGSAPRRPERWSARRIDAGLDETHQ